MVGRPAPRSSSIHISEVVLQCGRCTGRRLMFLTVVVVCLGQDPFFWIPAAQTNLAVLLGMPEPRRDEILLCPAESSVRPVCPCIRLFMCSNTLTRAPRK